MIEMGARFRRIVTAHDAQGRSIISGAAPPTQALRFAGEVDAAIDFGGPVEASFAPDRSMLQFGMADVVGNVMGYDRRRETAEVMNASSWSLRPLLDEERWPGLSEQGWATVKWIVCLTAARMAA